MTDAEIDAVVKGLSEAQRDVLTKNGKWNFGKVCERFLSLGIIARVPPFHVDLTTLGLAVRARLLGEG